jgi:hypothetical protein
MQKRRIRADFIGAGPGADAPLLASQYNSTRSYWALTRARSVPCVFSTIPQSLATDWAPKEADEPANQGSLLPPYVLRHARVVITSTPRHPNK